VHQEACRHLHRTIQNIKAQGIKAGVSINPATPVSTLSCILADVDLVLIMSVNPGFGGQSFIDSTVDKVRELAQIKKEKNLDFAIEIDGGVTLDNAAMLAEAGVEIAVAGSAVFKASDVASTVKKFKEIV
jgi:ribulose-phosphate 3-epimerase